MRRIGAVYGKAVMRDSLIRAHLQARRGKRSHRSCMEFERAIGYNINSLHCELVGESYRPRPLSSFMVYEPKPRLIEAPAYRDLVVQHSFYEQLMPFLERKFLRNNFACRIGMGTHACADYVQSMMRRAPEHAWILHIDVEKFFYSINREVLAAVLERQIKCKRTLRLLDLFANRQQPSGIPIGNLLSQLFALVYLSEADHFIKRELHAAHYARYMDDMILVCASRNQARELSERIAEYLLRALHLKTSKTLIAPIRRGINFCGFRTWRKTRVIRKRALRLATKAVRAGDASGLNSYLGHALHTASHQYLMTYCQEHNHDLYRSLPASHHAAHCTAANPPA